MQKYNVITFSLWGDKPKYLQGMIENCRLAPLIYPNWVVRLYVGNSVPKSFLKELHSEFKPEIYLVSDEQNKGEFYGAFWRFWANDDPNVDYYIVRDCDSRLNWREKAAVDEWIKSKKSFHIMRDHKNHTHIMQAGMWGGRANIIKNLKQLTDKQPTHFYHNDQVFLANILYPQIKNDCLVHDPYYENKPFPVHQPILSGGTFVGQIFDEYNKCYMV
jgi:hypothetical protein